MARRRAVARPRSATVVYRSLGMRRTMRSVRSSWSLNQIRFRQDSLARLVNAQLRQRTLLEATTVIEQLRVLLAQLRFQVVPNLCDLCSGSGDALATISRSLVWP